MQQKGRKNKGVKQLFIFCISKSEKHYKRHIGNVDSRCQPERKSKSVEIYNRIH